MRLTDTTVVYKLGNGRVVIADGTAPATFIAPSDVFPCGWLYEGGYTEDGDRIIHTCLAPAVGFDNGFACAAGHDHRNDAEYYEADEAEAYRKAGHTLAPNARLMDGRPL